MSFARDLAGGRYLRSRLVRFILVGGACYLVNLAALYVLYEYFLENWSVTDRLVLPFGLDAGLLVASLVAVELSILLRFVLNDRWTFRHHDTKPAWQRFYQSNVTSFGSPVISLTAVNVLPPVVGMDYLIANSLGIALGFTTNWFLSSRLVWRTTNGPEPEKRRTD